MDEEINLLDYLRVIMKYKRMITTLFLVAVVITMIVSLLMPKIYESTASILPPQEDSSVGNLSALLAASGAGGMIAGFLPSSGKGELFVTILKSRTMTDDLIDSFHLLKVYRVKLRAEARQALSKNIRINRLKDGTIMINVQDKDPHRAAKMANFYAANLDKLSRTLSISKAKDTRIFIEKRLSETKEALNRAEEELRAFQSENKVIELSEQAKAAISAAADLRAKITELELQLKLLQSYATGSNPEVENLKLQIKELKSKLRKLEQGNNHNQGLDISFSKAPSLGLRFIRLTREVKIQEAVFTILTQQYEQAKISEAKDMPTVQVLDYALPAEKKCKPKIKLNMAIAGSLSLFVGVFLAFLSEYLKKFR